MTAAVVGLTVGGVLLVLLVVAIVYLVGRMLHLW